MDSRDDLLTAEPPSGPAAADLPPQSPSATGTAVALLGEDGRSGLLDRTWGNLRVAWRDIAASAYEWVGALRSPRGAEEDGWRAQIQACLDGRGGEVSARARAADLGRTYLALDPDAKLRFLRLLAQEFDVDRAAVDRAVQAFNQAADTPERGRAERSLRQVLEPGRLRLLMQFNGLPEGVKFLVQMRAELLELSREDSLLGTLEADLKDLLRSWFDVGFLDLRRITWDSPAALLEKLIRYEAVHAIRGWQDLKNRLDSDRRCFAFFHPRMPDEPLIFVEVALVRGMSDSIHPLLDEAAPTSDPGQADTAIFYSISNAQKGLAGISFGNFLIKRVVDLLEGEFPNLKRFATLSPIPGFRTWLEGEVRAHGDGVLTPAELERLKPLVTDPDRPVLSALLGSPDLVSDPVAGQAVRPVLLRLCAHYLLNARKKSRASDPVAHFHLSNGARVERLNWQADLSAKGVSQSFGIMVNYAYRVSEIDGNHESYRGDGKVVASSAIKGLLKS